MLQFSFKFILPQKISLKSLLGKQCLIEIETKYWWYSNF